MASFAWHWIKLVVGSRQHAAAEERSAGAGSTVFTQIATVGANVTSFSNAGLTASTSYSYRVRAYNADGDSGYSNTAGATTPAAAATPMRPAS